MTDARGSKVCNPLVLKGLSSRQLAGRIIFYVILMTSLISGVLCVWNAVKWVDKPFAGFLTNRRMVVGFIGQYSWTGTQAGLKNPDKIVRANGRNIISPRDLGEIIESTKTGDPVTYSVSRDNRLIEVTVPTMRFSLTDLVMTFGIIFFLGILFLIIGAVVFVLKPDTWVSWVFFLGCFLQSTSFFMSFDMETTHAFTRPYLFIDAYLPAVVVHLSLLFPQRTRLADRHPSLQAVPYILSTIMVVPVQIFYPGPLFSQVYKFVLFYAVISVLALISSVLRAFFSRESVLARERAKVVLFGSVLALPVPAAAPFLASTGSTVGGVNIITNFSSIPMVIFPASIAYAIAKHNLFDVDVYIKRAVGYVLMTALVGVSYFAIQLVVRNVILKPVFGGLEESISQVLFAVLVVLILSGPISRKIQDRVDKLFFRMRVNYRDTVISVSKALSSMLKLDDIIGRIISTVRAEMFIDSAGIILLNPQNRHARGTFVFDSEKPGGDALSREVCLLPDDSLIHLMAAEKKILTLFDIEEDPCYASCRDECRQRFTEMHASLVIPLIYQNELTGVLALGNKKSGHFYSREDIDLLNTLAGQGAVAVENARLAEQMKEEEMKRTHLSRYLSPHVVDQIMQRDVQVNLAGNRKVVTVLFSDIRHFTRIAESFPPDRLVELLNEYFTEMADIVFRFRGSLDKYIGDAIVAVFGSLIPLESPEKNAALAAGEMMKRLAQLNEGWKERFGLELAIGIGINTGEVFLGTVGAPQRMEFAVIGDPVNVAARLSGLAAGGQILITRETMSGLNSGIRCNQLPSTEIKGKTGKMEIFEVLYA